MLSIQKIEVKRASQTLLSQFSLDIDAQSFWGITGANGAGKSTLLKAISGDLACTGHILFHQRPMSDWPRATLARHLGVLPQSSALTFGFSAAEVVSMGLTPLTISRRDSRRLVKEKMVLLDCAHLANHSYPTLSGGERQRVHMARVLVQLSQAKEMPLLLLDEPTSAQDIGHQHHILALVKQLTKSGDLTALAVLHDINHVLRYCTHSCVIDQGSLALVGKPSEVLTPNQIDKYWKYCPELYKNDSGQQALL